MSNENLPNEDVSLADVESALRVFEVTLKAAECEPSSRKSAFLALMGAHDFVNTIRPFEEQSLASPLFALALALSDLESGRVVPWLKSKSKGYGNKHPDCSSKMIMKAYAIRYVDVLEKSGVKIKYATKFVKDELLKSNFKVGGTVKTWRDELSRLPPENLVFSLVTALRSETAIAEGMTPERAKSLVRADIRYRVSKVGRYALD